jgi:hypothetical protein
MIDYTCRNCRHTFSRLVLRGEEEGPAVCPQCRNPRVLPTRASAGLFDGIASFSSLSKDTN